MISNTNTLINQPTPLKIVCCANKSAIIATNKRMISLGLSPHSGEQVAVICMWKLEHRILLALDKHALFVG